MVWNEAIQEVYQQWADHFDAPWKERLAEFNRSAAALGAPPFWLPHARCGPAWFNGNLRHMEPGKWVLIVSLNPHIDPGNNKIDEQEFLSSADWMRFWEGFNDTRQHWKGSFFPRLGQLASACLGLEMNREQAKDFVGERMIFIEFCPYASSKLPGIKWKEWKRLATDDPAMRISRHIRQLLFDYGQPGLVLCNGKFATYDVKDLQFDVTNMSLHKVRTGEQGSRAVAIYAATYHPAEGDPFRVLGFNQIGRQFSQIRCEMDAIQQIALGAGLSGK